MELLFCIAVIVVIASICWPLYLASRPVGPLSGCRSNVKQASLAILIYSDDYDDRLPLSSKWGDMVERESRNPAALKDVEGVPDGSFGYAFRKSAPRTQISSVRNMDTLALIFDSTLMSKNAVGEVDSLPSPGRHDGKDVIGYLDGHVHAVPVP